MYFLSLCHLDDDKNGDYANTSSGEFVNCYNEQRTEVAESTEENCRSNSPLMKQDTIQKKNSQQLLYT
jgi:hypothetical protein